MSFDKGEEEEHTGVQLQKKAGLRRNIIVRYWICQLRNGVIRPMILTKLTNNVKRALPSISNTMKTKLK